jgi:hypothetical protein
VDANPENFRDEIPAREAAVPVLIKNPLLEVVFFDM